MAQSASAWQSSYPNAVFVGFRHGEDLARHLAAADVMVFPSLTDTFGLVNLEAMACGVPVAAFPVTGPIDVVEDGVTGALDWDLAAAARRALKCASAGLPATVPSGPTGPAAPGNSKGISYPVRL